MAVTATIPIVFGVGDDPVKWGIVAGLGRPNANATGINFFAGEVVAKRLGLLRELVPAAVRIALLLNPTDPARSESVLSDVETAAGNLALKIQALNASTSREIEVAFATLARERPDALFVGPDGFFNRRRVQLALLAARHAIPTTFAVREYADAGGLMSYGTNLADMHRQVATSWLRPPATMRSACADASPARTSSISSSAVNPFANISASVQREMRIS